MFRIMNSGNNITLGPCGKTDQECRSLYEQSIPCQHFATLDSDSDDPFNPDNCVYYSQYYDQMVEEELRRNPPEEE